MKNRLFKTICAVLTAAVLLTLLSCSGAENKAPEGSADAVAGKSFNSFEYTHYASGGATETYNAVIIFEQSNSTFTAYQVAYSSCNCRNPIVNYYMVCYVEILNTKKSPEQASIRDITCLDNKGVWGDSNPNYYISYYTDEYMNEHLVKGFIGASKEELDAFEGYGTWIDRLDADSVAGATVSSSNMQSMLKSLFEYHVSKYYKQ